MPHRRRSLSLVLALALALAALGAAVPPGRAQDADIITIGVTDLPRTLDPGEAYDFEAWEVLRHLYTGLTRQVPGSLDVELALAQSVTVSDDRLAFAFTLRPDTAFSDGTPITAQTFVDSIQRVRTLRGGVLQAVEPYVASVNAPDVRTLVFHLTRPVPYFLQLVALPPYLPQHPDLAATRQPQPFADGLIGNGPYLLDAFDVHGSITLTPNPSYTLGPAPANDGIVLRQYERSQALRDALLAGEVDVAWRALFLEHLLELQDNPALQVVEMPSTRVFYFLMSQAREPGDDPLVREALTLLLERETAARDVFHGHLSPLTSLVPALFPEAYDPIWPDEPDIPTAEEILRAASYGERVSSRLALSLVFSQLVYGDPYVAAVTQFARSSFHNTGFIQLGGIFFDVEPNTFYDMLSSGSASLAVFGWTPLVAHPDAYLRPLLHHEGLLAEGNEYTSPEVDALLDEAARLDDPAAQGALYQTAAQWALDHHVLAPLWQDHLVAVAQQDVSGVTVEPNFFLHYDLLTHAK